MARRRTIPQAKVLAALLELRGEDAWGLEIASLTRLATGTIYPILIQLQADGLVESWWEDVDPSVVGRPRRRLYRLTGQGVERAVERQQEVAARRPEVRLLPGLAPS